MLTTHSQSNGKFDSIGSLLTLISLFQLPSQDSKLEIRSAFFSLMVPELSPLKFSYWRLQHPALGSGLFHILRSALIIENFSK